MKLFQNLSTDLAEECVKSLFLFIALAAILFNVAELFDQIWLRVTQETFLYNYFKIHHLVQEKKSFKGFSTFSSGSHLVQWSGDCLSNFGRGSPKEPTCKIISKSVKPFWKKSHLKQKVDNTRTTDDGHRLITIAHHEHFVLRRAKNTFRNMHKPNSNFEFFSK